MFDILRRRKGMTLKLCPNKEGTFLWKNYGENVHRKLVRDPFLILVNNPK